MVGETGVSVPRAQVAGAGAWRGLGIFGLEASFFSVGTSEKPGSGGGEVRDRWGERGREGAQPSLGPTGIQWLWPPPTQFFLPARASLGLSPMVLRELEILALTEQSWHQGKALWSQEVPPLPPA